MQRNQEARLDGKSLVVIILDLVDEYGWKELSELTKINNFHKSPNFTSSLKYLNKTPSARKKVEQLYLKMMEIKNTGKRMSLLATTVGIYV